MASNADAVKAQNAAAQAATQARNEQQALDYFNAMDNFYLRQYSDKQNKTLTDQIQKDQFKDALQVSDMQKDAQLRAFDTAEERYREQLKVNEAEFNRAKSGLDSQFDSTLRSYEDQIVDQDRAFTQEFDRASFDRDTVQRRKTDIANQYGEGGTQRRSDALSIQRARDALTRRASLREEDKTDITTQETEIQEVRKQTDLIIENQLAAADLEDARALLNRDSQLANIAFQKQGQRIETLARIGQAKARGRKGKSADRTLQTTLALSGINVARLTNQAFFAQKEYSGAQSVIANRKAAIGFQDQISKLRETAALDQLETRGNRLTAETTADTTEGERLDTQETLLGDIASNQFTSGTAEADQQLDEIAYAIGLSREQLTMNKKRLGASLVSTVAAIDDQLLSLEQAKYKADYNAHAARMLPPEFAADAKAPYDVPLPKYIEPRPGAAPAPAYQAQYVPPPTQSGLSQALMIGGAALSIAAIPFTLGASAAVAGGVASTAAAGGLLGSMTVGTATAVGTGLAAGGAGLTKFSQMPFMYN
tara:strand:+ start:7482 stop:9095 length:1614 start_codon:yes stop_codon:yes gene_type:complete